MRFFVTVLVPRRVPVENLEFAVVELMAPYDFDSDAGDDRRCPCGRTFTDYAADQIRDQLVPYGKEAHSLLRAMVERIETRSRVRDVLRRHERPNPACPYCHGSGHYDADFKPSSEFDGISYGWDWTGWIRDEPRRLGPDQPEPTIAENVATVPELLACHEAHQDICTNSLLTPDGEWFSCGFRLWSSNHEFEAGFIERLSRNRECWAVGLECHR